MSGGGKGGGEQTTGYRYFFGIHMGIGRGPVDAIHEIRVGDRKAWEGNATGNGTIQIDAYDLFGGEGKEGGIKGALEVMMGGATQTASPGLLAMLGGPLPGFRRMVTAFFDGIIGMNNPYPKPWKFRLNRVLQGWDGPVFAPTLAAVPLTVKRPEDAAAPLPPVNYVKPPAGWTYGTSGGGFGGNGATVNGATVNGGYFHGVGWRRATMMPLYFREGGNGSSNPRPPSPQPPPAGWVVISTEPFIKGHKSGGAYFAAADTPGYYAPPDHAAAIDPVRSDLTTIMGMNAAHIIYECLTNREWGRGLGANRFDTASWEAAAQTLYSEGFGLCLKWVKGGDEIGTFVQSVIDHIGAAMFVDRTTALLKLKLIRGDYDFEELDVYDSESGLIEVRQSGSGVVAKSITGVAVTYRDQLSDEERVVTVNNPAALMAANGAPNVLKKSYPGIATPELATRVAQRDLLAGSTTLKRFTLVFDRRGARIEPGSVIAIKDLSRGIPKTAVRVVTFEEGPLGDGKILINAVQDVFALPDVSYAADVPSNWVAPSGRACVPADQRVIEAPYFMLAGQMSAADLDYTPDDAGFAVVMSAKGNPMNVEYKISVRDTAPTPDDTPPDGSYNCGI